MGLRRQSTSKTWTLKTKRDLEAAFDTYSPRTQKDWKKMAGALLDKWSVDELKVQSKKMGLKPLVIKEKSKTENKALITQIKSLNGKLPTKGTIRHEALKEEVMKHLYVRRVDNAETDSMIIDDNTDEAEEKFIHAAMANYGLDELMRRIPDTPSRRTFFPTSVSSRRTPLSQEAIDVVGDDFSMPDRRRSAKYKFQYRAQQVKRRSGKTSDKMFNELTSLTEDNLIE